MKLAESHCWKLCISGADRRELADAFRDSPWKDSWFDHSSPLEDNDPDAGIQMSLDIPDMDTLVVAINCIGHLKPSYGINLHCKADFGEVRVNSSLSTTYSGFEVSSFSLHRTAKSLELATISKLNEAEKALGELRTLLAEKGNE